MGLEDDLKQILDFIQELPNSGLGNPLQPLFDRYGLHEPDVMAGLLGGASQSVTSSVQSVMKKPERMQEITEQLGHAPDVGELFNISMQSGFLQMFAVGCEYARRKLLPDLLAEALAMNGEIDQLLNGEDHD